jgi:hypothetical protein
MHEQLAKLEDWKVKMDTFLDNLSIPPTQLPTHRLGVHWLCDQYRQADLDYMAALKPPVIKIVNPSADRIREALARIHPAGHVALRYHPISEQHSGLADPIALGKAHATYWIQYLDTVCKSLERSTLYVMGLNEPSIHNTNEANRVALYTEAFLKELLPHHIRAYVFNFSVGWPREEAGRIIWDEFAYLEPLINEADSFGCVHEYGYPSLASGWNSYGNRVSRCPLRIRFVIGECGYTRQLANLPQPWGWDGNISADTYADMLWDYAVDVDPNKVFAVCPFTTSYGGSEWRSKDTAKAHTAILDRKPAYIWPNPWPYFPEQPSNSFVTVWPKMSKITQWYGPTHSGLDISMTMRTPLYAMLDGVVAWAGIDTAANGGYGKYIRIYYKELGFDSFFAHCDELLVQTGTPVKRGQLVAYSGNTGNSTGPHLHLEIRIKQDDSPYDRIGVGPFGRGQVDPMGVKWALYGILGIEEK